jgi:antitoxin (DNA-binding transcriptional repressor) of toxin-antitoxin stability system
MRQITLEEAKNRLLDLLEAALRGKEIFIIMEDQQLIKLVAIEVIKPKRRPQFGNAKGL